MHWSVIHKHLHLDQMALPFLSLIHVGKGFANFLTIWGLGPCHDWTMNLNMMKNRLERGGLLNQLPQCMMVLSTNGQALSPLEWLQVSCVVLVCFPSENRKVKIYQINDTPLEKHIKRDSKITKGKFWFIYFSWSVCFLWGEEVRWGPL